MNQPHLQAYDEPAIVALLRSHFVKQKDFESIHRIINY